MQNDVYLAIEGNKESFIQEIALNGQETWIQPMSMSEKFTRSTQRIDFFKELEGSTEAQEAAPVKPEPKDNPWDAVRKNIVDALTEVRVLHDVLAVLNHNPAAVPQQPGPPPQKILHLAGVQSSSPAGSDQMKASSIMAKKKAFEIAARVITDGAKRLERSERQPDFHQELQNLRQHYRLRRKGEKILGDLSYRTAGSTYPALGEFEVLRDADCSRENCPLTVRLPHELQSMAWLSIRIVHCGPSDSLKVESSQETTVSTYHHVISSKEKTKGYLEELKQAQNSLFTRELFSQLCREVSAYRPIVPIYMIGDTITTQIFPDTKLVLELCRKPFKAGDPKPFDKSSDRRWFCLEQHLTKLLRVQHSKAKSFPAPHPTIATMGMTKKQRTAATKPYNRSRIERMVKTVPMIQKIIEAAKHAELLRRVEEELDQIAKETAEPNIHVHWPVVQNPVHTSIKIHFSVAGYEMCTKQFGMHSMLLNVAVNGCSAVQRDGNIVELGSCTAELRRLIEGELLSMQIACLAGLVRIIDWTVLSSRRGAILIAPPIASEGQTGRVVVRTENRQLRVFIESKRDSTTPSDIITDEKWQLLHSNEWHEIEWEKLAGANFVGKMDLMLSCLCKRVTDKVQTNPNCHMNLIL